MLILPFTEYLINDGDYSISFFLNFLNKKKKMGYLFFSWSIFLSQGLTEETGTTTSSVNFSNAEALPKNTINEATSPGSRNLISAGPAGPVAIGLYNQVGDDTEIGTDVSTNPTGIVERNLGKRRTPRRGSSSRKKNGGGMSTAKKVAIGVSMGIVFVSVGSIITWRVIVATTPAPTTTPSPTTTPTPATTAAPAPATTATVDPECQGKPAGEVPCADADGCNKCTCAEGKFWTTETLCEKIMRHQYTLKAGVVSDCPDSTGCLEYRDFLVLDYGYDTLDDAQLSCDADSDCGLVMQYGDSKSAQDTGPKYYLRRTTDPQHDNIEPSIVSNLYLKDPPLCTWLDLSADDICTDIQDHTCKFRLVRDRICQGAAAVEAERRAAAAAAAEPEQQAAAALQ